MAPDAATQVVPGSNYALPRNEEERSRLTEQHEFLKRTFDGKIRLSPISLQEGDSVLDACTGNGVWLVDLAKEVPDGVQLEGIDIQPRLFPPEESRPKNIQFSVHSVLSLPSEWTNRFSVVHQRLLVLALMREEWPVALRELYRVTKPGGWAELSEFTKWKGGPANDRLWEFRVTSLDRMGFLGDSGEPLERMMREAGFEDVQVVKRSCPIGKWGGEQGILAQDSQVRIAEMLKPKMLKVSGDIVKSEEDFRELMDQVVEEYDNLKCAFDWMVCLGRKPSMGSS